MTNIRLPVIVGMALTNADACMHTLQTRKFTQYEHVHTSNRIRRRHANHQRQPNICHFSRVFSCDLDV